MLLEVVRHSIQKGLHAEMAAEHANGAGTLFYVSQYTVLVTFALLIGKNNLQITDVIEDLVDFQGCFL
jgi:hypothetical protein